MTQNFDMDDDYVLAVQYITSILEGDLDFASNIQDEVDDDTLIQGLSLMNVFLFAELKSRYPGLSVEEFSQRLIRKRLD